MIDYEDEIERWQIMLDGWLLLVRTMDTESGSTVPGGLFLLAPFMF